MAVPRQAGITRSADRRRLARLVPHLEPFAALALLIIIFVVFSAWLPDTFPTWSNVRTLLLTQDTLVLVTIGLLLPLAAGEFDLSIGFVFSFAGIEVAALTTVFGVPTAPAILITLASACLIGLVNGLLVVGVGINALIATLGTGTIVSGLITWISGGRVLGPQGFPPLLLAIGNAEWAGLQIPVFVMIGAGVTFAYIFRYTPFGRYLYAIGGGRVAARLSGVNTGRLTIVAFVGCAAIAALAGILQTGISTAAYPDAGNQFLLPAYATAFLGATAIEPGRFNVPGAFVAVFLLAALVDGLEQLGAPFWVSPVLNGLALITAVGLSVLRERRR